MSDDHNYRMAALKLHGLHPKDRTWLLERFDGAQQNILRNLINELDDLGFVSIEKIHDKDISYPVGNYQLDTNIVSEINQSDPELIMRTLNDLPDLLKAMILHARRWQWSSRIWPKFEQHERQRLIRLANQFDSIKDPVFATLIESFAEALRKGRAPNQPTMQFSQSKFWMA